MPILHQRAAPGWIKALTVFVGVAGAAGVALFAFRGEGVPSQSGPGAVQKDSLLPAASHQLTATGAVPRQPQVDAAPQPALFEAPASGVAANHEARLMAALAAAQRNGSSKQPGAASAEQGLAILQRLAEEQARKDAVPLDSPFGANRAADRP